MTTVMVGSWQRSACKSRRAQAQRWLIARITVSKKHGKVLFRFSQGGVLLVVRKRTGLETTRTLVKFLRKNAFFAQTDRTKLCERSEQGDTAPNRGKLVLELFGGQSLCPVLRVAWKICRQLGTHLLSQHPRKVISPTLKFAAPVCLSWTAPCNRALD